MTEEKHREKKEEKCCESDVEDDANIVELPKKPMLSFGINRILGKRNVGRSRSPSPTFSHSDTYCDHDSDNDDEENIDIEQNNSDVEPRSTPSSRASSPSLSTSKYDVAFASPAQSIYPLDLATSALLPLPGCSLYRSGHGIVKVPAQRPHTMLHMFNPYSIPWMDFRRDRFGGNLVYPLNTTHYTHSKSATVVLDRSDCIIFHKPHCTV